jgi:hypothetical protein
MPDKHLESDCADTEANHSRRRAVVAVRFAERFAVKDRAMTADATYSASERLRTRVPGA